ncbi:MAG: diacylglycerol/lipid kinase family protein [Flavitalea sp.]
MAKRKIAYLINPISGTRPNIKILEQIKERTIAAKIDFEIFHTNKEGNYNFLKPAIHNGSITDVVICGGDGSISKVAGALLEEDIRFGIVPMGSGNGLALTAKIPRTVNKALDIIFHCPDTSVDGFMINGAFSCMLCGLGFDAKVAHDFAASPTRGLKTYIKLSTLNFFKAKPYPSQLNVMAVPSNLRLILFQLQTATNSETILPLHPWQVLKMD